MKVNLRRNLQQYFGILFGAILFGAAYSWFLVPFKIAPGGVGGLAQIFFHFFNIPTGVTTIIINIPLFIISFFIFGPRFGVRSFFGMLATGLSMDFMSLQNLHKMGIIKNLNQYTIPSEAGNLYALLPDDIYLSGIAGAVLLGLSLGIIFRFRGSTGGTDIPVAFIKKKFGLSIGTGYWIVESVIIFTIGICFRDPKLIIWGYINLFITAKLTDMASEGLPYIKGVYIISDKNDEIKESIFKFINRGVTFFKGRGGYSGKDKDIIFCAVNRRQVAQLRDLVKDIDSSAFMILTDVHDVMGYGFKSRSLEISND